MLKVAWSWSRSLGFIFNFCTPLIPLLLLLLSPSAPSLFLWLIFLLLFLFDIIFSPCWVFGLLSVILPMAAQGFNVNWSQCVAPWTPTAQYTQTAVTISNWELPSNLIRSSCWTVNVGKVAFHWHSSNIIHLHNLRIWTALVQYQRQITIIVLPRTFNLNDLNYRICFKAND